ncbi:hypothetical protein [Methylobacterium sp. Leaf123]|uniref:hypothetical protein n=1 Tax=Methylobacterium sp. Leaf123 TaxID=1736264 RepID=UPI0012E9157B|nr:hypothetical protein [Methylobacterium sp. Leaf123]
MINIVASEEETHQRAKSLLTSQVPRFLSRIGGSDTDALMSYWKDPSNEGSFDYFLNRVKEYNGFYAIEGDQKTQYINYLNTLRECYQQSDELFVTNWTLLSAYYPQRIGYKLRPEDAQYLTEYREFIDTLFSERDGPYLHAYDFIERIVSNKFTLFNLLSELLPGKKVLVISPFSQTSVEQQSRKHKFFKNYTYPEFDLVTYDTPITYAGLPQEMYPDKSWQATVDRMNSEISAIDFDIALLSCGSYAMPLGIHIRDVCGKHAVYVGGCLQLFLGIMGRRWSGLPFFMDQMNPENFVTPAEGKKFHGIVTVDENTQADAFGAYF